MKKAMVMAFAVLAGMALSAGLAKADPPKGFSMKSLQGTYAATFHGTVDGTGIVNANGAGDITAGSETVNDGTNSCTGTLTGSYTVNSDGTGILTLSFSTTKTNFGVCPSSPTSNSAAIAFVSPDEIEVSGTDPGVLVSGSLTRQAPPFHFGRD
jgi:hypothetical protein